MKYRKYQRCISKQFNEIKTKLYTNNVYSYTIKDYSSTAQYLAQQLVLLSL